MPRPAESDVVQPPRPEFMGEVAETLRSEREAVRVLLEQRHAALLADFDEQLRSSAAPTSPPRAVSSSAAARPDCSGLEMGSDPEATGLLASRWGELKNSSAAPTSLPCAVSMPLARPNWPELEIGSDPEATGLLTSRWGELKNSSVAPASLPCAASVPAARPDCPELEVRSDPRAMGGSPTCPRGDAAASSSAAHPDLSELEVRSDPEVEDGEPVRRWSSLSTPTTPTSPTSFYGERAGGRVRLRSRKGETKSIGTLAQIAASERFEAVFALLIVANALTMAVEMQYRGIDVGREIGFPGSYRTASEAWPGADTAFGAIEVAFGSAFAAEVLVKILGLRRQFMWSLWNWFDTVIIVLWVIDQFKVAGDLMNPMILRLARFGRLLRLLRLVRTIQVFNVLHLLLGSLAASVYSLLWSIFLLFFVMLTAALAVNFLLEQYFVDGDERLQAFDYFGTFSRGMLTLCELTLGNWVPVTRFLHNNVSEWFGPCIMAYQCVVSFAVVTVIRGIFLHETFQVADSDDELMIMKKQMQAKKHDQKMQLFFSEADVDSDGYLTRDEFQEVMCDPRVKAWLAAMGLEIREPKLVFDLVDDGDDRLEVAELVQGFSRLKGAASGLDMVTMLHENRRFSKSIFETLERIQGLEEAVAEICGQLRKLRILC